MVLEGIVSSPMHRRKKDELGSWSALFQRHRYLLTALALLAFLCTIYLYFAVTFSATPGSCLGLKGTQKATCELRQAGSTLHGKLKFF